MELSDLRSFLVIARHSNLRSASEELHLSASALSKALRRIEGALSTTLFDRVGKSIRLNPQGERLLAKAQVLLAQADQMQADFRGPGRQVHCRLIGPAVLQWRFGPALAQALAQQAAGGGMAFVVAYEDAALSALSRGEADFALITRAALDTGLSAGLESVPLGSITMQLAAGPSHPLLASRSAAHAKSRASSKDKVRAIDEPPPSALEVCTAEVLQHDFACPARSMFCGLERGARADGWRDDQLPRRIRFWLDDLQLLLALVRSGQALAYLPDFALAEQGLLRLMVLDCPYECVEQIYLAWRPATASSWQNGLVTQAARWAGATRPEGPRPPHVATSRGLTHTR